MTFVVELSTKAADQFRKLDKPTQEQILKRLRRLAEDLELAKPLSHGLKNNRSERIGKHRVVFAIVGNKLAVAKIEHRDTVYG